MRATVMYQAGDVRVENVPDPVLREPTDAIVRVTSACICGSDLWPYQSMPANEQGRRMGHEFIGIVEEVGAEVSGFARGDLVVAPFVWSDNTCDFCAAGLQIACRHGGGWGAPGRRRRSGRSRAGPAGSGHAGQASRRAGLGADAVAADAVRRVLHRPPRRRHRRSAARPHRDRHRRRRRRTVRRARGQAARRGADHPDGQAHRPHRPGPRVRRHGRRRCPRRGGRRTRAGTDPGRRHARRPRVCRHLAVDRDRRKDRARRRCDQPHRRAAVHRGPAGFRHRVPQHHLHRRCRPGPRLHRRTDARHPRRHRRTGPGLRPHDRPGRSPRRVQGHGRTRITQSPDPP